MARKFVDCRETPSVANCSLRISGEEEEVVRAAAMHASDVHGHQDTPEFRQMIRSSLKEDRADGAPRVER